MMLLLISRSFAAVERMVAIEKEVEKLSDQSREDEDLTNAIETVEQKQNFLAYFMKSFADRTDHIIDEVKEAEKELIEVEEFLDATNHLETYKDLAQLTSVAQSSKQDQSVDKISSVVSKSSQSLFPRKSLLSQLAEGAKKRQNIKKEAELKDLKPDQGPEGVEEKEMVNDDGKGLNDKESSKESQSLAVLLEDDIPTRVIELVSNQDAQDRSDTLGTEIGVECRDEDVCSESDHIMETSAKNWPLKPGMKDGGKLSLVSLSEGREDSETSNMISNSQGTKEEGTEGYSPFKSFMSFFY